MSTAAQTPTAPATVQLARIEAREDRTQRLSTGWLLVLIGLLLAWGGLGTTGTATIALSDYFDEIQLPQVPLPAQLTVGVCAALVLLAGAAFLSGRLRGTRWGAVAGTVAAIAVLVGFIAWMTGGRTEAFMLTNQLNATLAVATPLVLGTLCGVFSERAGVVNVAIEGQFLVAAFAGGIVGSLTQSVTAGVVAAVAAGVAMAALLGVFALKYLVDHVILGVVLNLLASGLTGFLFNQLVSKDAARYNAVPLMQPVAIPWLSEIPFAGPILFNQTLLAYLAFFVAVPLGWFLLFKTKWGLRVRAVGEHPHAADTVGIDVVGTKFSSVLLGGVFAGLGGAYFTLVSSGEFRPDISAGYGFIALAALIMGRWHPVLGALMALFFGFVLQLGQAGMSAGAGVDSSLMQMLPYIATIVAVAGLVGRVRGPAADGQPFIKE